jgi:hypothetical protein
MTARNTNRLSTLIAASATLLALAFGGCATGGAEGRPNTADVRGKVAIVNAGPRAIAEGPGRLLHVDVQGGEGVNVYSVMPGPDGTADCGGPQLSKPAALHADSNELNLDLAPGQVVCLSVDAGLPAEVAWHLRQQASSFGPALLLAKR